MFQKLCFVHSFLRHCDLENAILKLKLQKIFRDPKVTRQDKPGSGSKTTRALWGLDHSRASQTLTDRNAVSQFCLLGKGAATKIGRKPGNMFQLSNVSYHFTRHTMSWTFFQLLPKSSDSHISFWGSTKKVLYDELTPLHTVQQKLNLLNLSCS